MHYLNSGETFNCTCAMCGDELTESEEVEISMDVYCEMCAAPILASIAADNEVE